jgi:mRNA interferase MazF
MLRGEIRWADLEPVRGSESNKRRPVIIVSNDGANLASTRLGRGTVTVVPVTGNTAVVFSFQVPLSTAATGLDRPSKAQPEQVRTIDVSRIGGRIGVVPVSLMAQIDDALRLHLGL